MYMPFLNLCMNRLGFLPEKQSRLIRVQRVLNIEILLKGHANPNFQRDHIRSVKSDPILSCRIPKGTRNLGTFRIRLPVIKRRRSFLT